MCGYKKSSYNHRVELTSCETILRDNNVIVKCVLANSKWYWLRWWPFFLVTNHGVERREIIRKSKMVNYFNNGDYYDVEMLYAVSIHRPSSFIIFRTRQWLLLAKAMKWREWKRYFILFVLIFTSNLIHAHNIIVYTTLHVDTYVYTWYRFNHKSINFNSNLSTIKKRTLFE